MVVLLEPRYDLSARFSLSAAPCMIEDVELGLDLLAEPLPGALEGSRASRSSGEAFTLDPSRAEGIIDEQVEARERVSW